jgi:hypothetical protein
MAASGDRTPFADSRALRLVALGVLVGSLAALVYMHRADLWPQPQLDARTLNPDFVSCRDERTATVDTMLSEGVIDEARHAQFTDRAIAICADQFPTTAAPGE